MRNIKFQISLQLTALVLLYIIIIAGLLKFWFMFKEIRIRNRINISELNNLTKGEIVEIIKERQELISKGNNFCLYLFSFSIIITLLFSFLIFYSYYKAKKREAMLESFLSLLPEDERKVYKLLLEKKEVYQSDISKLLNSRVRAHRIIKKLERDGIIERIPYGNTYIIKLIGKKKNNS